LFDRLDQSVGCDELIKDILQNIFNILIVGDSLSDEIAEAWLLLPDGFRDPLIFLIRPSMF
jgi:hypothetical protein